MGSECGAGLAAVAVDDVDDTRRETSFGDQLAEDQDTKRGLFGGFSTTVLRMPGQGLVSRLP
jgi:hypothetical protein